MKVPHFIFIILIIASVSFSALLAKYEKKLASNTQPAFNYLEFEMPPNQDFSKKLFASIHENEMTAVAQESLDKDFWYIFLYVSTAVLGAILLLQKMKIHKNWLFILIAILGITAGLCDYFENGYLEDLLNNWEAAAAEGAVEKASNFAKIKFAIILPMLVSVLLGWVFVLGKMMLLRIKK